jgi:ceramide glucosyltransferase
LIDMIDLLFIALASFAALATLAAGGSLFWYTRPRRRLADHTPPVTILKPLKGVDEGLERNLRSFFYLDYPHYQVVFGVADADDPAIAIVEKLLAEYPERDAMLVVGNPAFGLNPKIENLAAIYPRRKHDVILISDSNVEVRPSFLRDSASYLADPSVGIVTNVFCGAGERRFGAVLENLQLNGFIAANMCGAFALRITCVVGKSMLMPVKALEAIGGFASVRNLLAEDQAIGVKVRKAGYSIRLSHHIIENVNETRDLSWFLNRHSRWLKIRYRMSLVTFLLEPFVNLTAIGLVWVLASASPLSLVGMLALCGLAMMRDAVQSRWLRGTWPRLSHLPLGLLKDLFMLPIWFDALVNRRISWRGHRFVVGKFTRVRSRRTTRAARERVRRVRSARKQSTRKEPDRLRPRLRRFSRPVDRRERPNAGPPTTPSTGAD